MSETDDRLAKGRELTAKLFAGAQRNRNSVMPAKFQEYTTGEFFRGVSLLLGAAVSVAFISRVAKNFQDYYINVVTQRLGAQLYSDGIRHSLELPYSVFEDQRSGETLGKLQKVRTDVEKLISVAINVLFTSLVGIINGRRTVV